MSRFLRLLGRLGQFAGLCIRLVAIPMELAGAIGPANMLVMLVLSVAAFWLGRLVEGLAGP